jgi:hypothetical protein
VDPKKENIQLPFHTAKYQKPNNRRLSYDLELIQVRGQGIQEFRTAKKGKVSEEGK